MFFDEVHPRFVIVFGDSGQCELDLVDASGLRFTFMQLEEG